MPRLLTPLLLALALVGAPAIAPAAEEAPEPPDLEWSFEGFFGTIDDASAQRGYLVYEQVCASCHAMEQMFYRNLTDIGVSDNAAAAVAAEHQVQDGPDDTGEMFMRSARLSDRFPAPYANEQAARASNGGAYPPDLSLIVKARENGADYVHGILIGYEEPPPGVEPSPGQYYNLYFPGHLIGMPPPLAEGLIEYPDETEATVEQMSIDVTNFLAFAAEPRLDDRKQMGVKVIIFLIVLTGLLYAVKRRVWRDVH